MDCLSDPSLSAHDRIDAYATLAIRIRHLLHNPDTLCLGIHKDSVLCALRRDVHLAHHDPFSVHDELIINTTTIQRARESSVLSYHALCALVTIFRFPAFCSVFTDHDLSVLFGDVLDIALADHLPVVSQVKAYSLSLWALRCHRLPVTVLSSQRDAIFSALRRSLDVQRQPANIVLDGIKAIAHTVQHYPSPFLFLLAPLLPCLISNLHCDLAELCFHASATLAGFADALVSHPDLDSAHWRALSFHILSFLEYHHSLEDTPFFRMVRVPFSINSHARPGDGPARILVVLASLIVLCGPTLYTKQSVLRLILQSLAMALTHKRSVIRALHPHVWRCLIWSFRQMLLDPQNTEPTVVSSAFHVIKQEVCGGIGFALITVLLSDPVSTARSNVCESRVFKALSVIKDMVQTECKHTRREGFAFLQAFANDAQARQQIAQNMYEVPALVLFNGAILGAKWDGLPSTINSIPKVPGTIDWPGQIEIDQHYKTLLITWKHFAVRIDKSELDSHLVDVWLFILLACSRQLERVHRTVVTTEALIFSATIVTEFLPSVPLRESQPDWASWNVHDQLCRLAFIDQLWSAMRKAFVSFSLAEAAEFILTSVLKYAFHVLDCNVRTLWGKFCASLMVTASSSFLRDVHNFTTSHLVISDQRQLWGVVAASLSTLELCLDQEELVQFLVIPACSWVLSGPELKAWETLLRKVTASGDCTIVAEILQCLQGKQIEQWVSAIPLLGFLLTFTGEQNKAPTDELLSMLDVCLAVSYDRARHTPDALAESLKLLHVIRCVIVSAQGKVMHIIQALGRSLCLWIEDHAEVMSNNEFNSVAVTLYCETLRCLENLPLSIQSLREMEAFLSSAFSRIPTPAIAPFAFEKFWRATYHGHHQFYDILPTKIKFSLVCFVAAYGGDLADGLSLTTESQSQNISDDSETRIPTAHQHFEVFDVDNTSCGHRIVTAQENITILTPSPDDDTPQPTVLRQLQEYSSRMDESSPSRSERLSPSCLASTFSLGNVTPNSHPPEKIRSAVTRVPSQKRKLAESDNIPRKRSRISRRALYDIRKLESEPATRDVTPISVPRMNSVPLGKRMVFDGVQVPTLHGVMRCQEAANIVSTEPGLGPISPTPSSGSSRRERSLSTLPPSVGSDEDALDWEDLRVDITSSEIDVDQSLADADPNLPLYSTADQCHFGHPTRTRPLLELDDKSHLPSGSNPHRSMSENGIPSPVPPRPSLQRAKTTSTRLDVLRDVYSSVANGASQIPMSELVQATRLVHQIGAVLTEQMGKKMGGPAG